MTPSEIARIARIASELGAGNIKLTGGEPLTRKDIVEIVRLLHQTATIKEISMVTNGTLLTLSLARRLRQNGLARLNINIPSVETHTYEGLTGSKMQHAIEGVRAALSAGLFPVKVNMLIIRNVNSDQIDSMLSFCSKTGVTLQIIELEPLNLDAEYYSRYHLPLDEIEKKISADAQRVEVRRSMHGRKVYHLRDVTVEIVRPVDNTEFCRYCTRMRLTSDGRLKPCLMRSDDLVDFIGPVRRGASDQELRDIMIRAVKQRQPFYGAKQVSLLSARS
jgi:cyclic pyranopterin phosphate synthase